MIPKEISQNETLFLELNKLEKEFNKKATEFKNKVDQYYRQSIYSKYITELELSNYVRDLNEIKNKILSVKDRFYANREY